MARKYQVSRKIYEIEKKLFSLSFWAEVGKSMGWPTEGSKSEAYDIIFSLDNKDQAKLFDYKLQKSKRHIDVKNRWVLQPDEIAQAFSFNNWEEFELAMRGRSVDVPEMVRLLTKGYGQQDNEGRRLKAQIDKLFNDDLEKGIVEIID